MEAVLLVLNKFPFFSNIAFDDSLKFDKFVISFLKSFSFLKEINVAIQGIVWRQPLRFTEDINRLEEEWVEVIDA